MTHRSVISRLHFLFSARRSDNAGARSLLIAQSPALSVLAQGS
jgi:hypothetical protein